MHSTMHTAYIVLMLIMQVESKPWTQQSITLKTQLQHTECSLKEQ